MVTRDFLDDLLKKKGRKERRKEKKEKKMIINEKFLSEIKIIIYDRAREYHGCIKKSRELICTNSFSLSSINK